MNFLLLRKFFLITFKGQKKDPSPTTGKGLVSITNSSLDEYLVFLKQDYKNKLKDPFWFDFYSLIQDELYKVEYKLHLLKEQIRKSSNGKLSGFRRTDTLQLHNQ